MDEEKKTRYFFLNVCRLGLLLIALSAIRALSIHQDALGFALGLGGFLFVTTHVKSLEKKWGITRMQSLLNAGIFSIVFLPLAYWLAYPF